MAKRANKADMLVFRALQKAFDQDKVHLCLITSKINVPGSPIYNAWEILLPTLCPLLVGLILIGLVGILWGLVFMTAGLLLSANLIKKKMEQRLLDRAKALMTSSYESCCNLWDFGGVILVKSDDKSKGCLSPEADWREFIVLNFAELMTQKKEETEAQNVEEQAA